MLSSRVQLLRYAPITNSTIAKWQTKFLTRALLVNTAKCTPVGLNRRDMHLMTMTTRNQTKSVPASVYTMRLHPASFAAMTPLGPLLPTTVNSRRHASTEIEKMEEVINSPQLIEMPDIPEPPVVPSSIAEVVDALGEPTFASIGLGGWSPVGIVQNCMEYLHVGCDIPWWGAIALGTIVVRTLIFPLVILAQRNNAKLNNNMPQMQLLQVKMTEARQSGNAIESARYAQEMMLFMREKGVNPLKNMIVPLAQAPLFISFFMGLRQMANAPVESMRDGGLWWFTDLTIADPLFLLPVITSATLYLTIEIGTDSARLSAANMNMMKYVLRALPLVIFPFTMNFPAGILTYWACSNFISLGQVAVLRIPAVRDFFKIDKLITHDPSSLPIKKKGFVGGMKESWQNMKISKEVEERQRLDEIRFAKAGQGPLIKTYKYDPTKPRPSSNVANPTMSAQPMSTPPKKSDSV